MFPGSAPPPPPPATTNTSTDVKEAGTVNVPGELNVVITGALTVIENALAVKFEAVSYACTVKLNVVLLDCASAVPVIAPV